VRKVESRIGREVNVTIIHEIARMVWSWAHTAWTWAGMIHLKDILPIAIALTALFVSLRDRRPRLALRARKGDWYKLDHTANGEQVLFRGIVEVYNVSARANAVREYEFWEKREGGDWKAMESEYFNDSDGKTAVPSNPTPLTIAPYSGTEVHVLAFSKIPQPFVMQIRIEVEDLFGKRYRVEVQAVS
jgi:hypothetical protein